MTVRLTRRGRAVITTGVALVCGLGAIVGLQAGQRLSSSDATTAAPPAGEATGPAATPTVQTGASAVPQTSASVDVPTMTFPLVPGEPDQPRTLVAATEGTRVGTADATTYAYSVEAVGDLQAELPALVAATDSALLNSDHGWTSEGDVALQRVADPKQARIRIVLAPAQVVDEMCARAGLDTIGQYSCWDGARTMLNADRWHAASEGFDNLDQYRTYLINHEVGHGLGHQHELCPRPGALAPLMQQQSISLQGCLPNGWPHP